MKDWKEKVSNFGRKVNKAAADAKDWILENKNVSIPAGIGLVVIVIICIVVGVTAGNQANTVKPAQTSSGEGSAIPVPEVALEQDSHEELNTLFGSYYAAIAAGDVDTVEQLRNYVGDMEKIAIEKRSEYIDAYTNMVCYTKPGPLEDSYVAYVYTEAKMQGFETLAPGIKTFLAYRGDDGSYKVMCGGEIDENLNEYMKQISMHADVEELFTRVQVKYAEMEASDEELKAFLDELSQNINTYVAEEIAKKEGSELAEAQTEEAETETETETETQEVNVVQTVAATSVVNIRTSDSETADKLGKAQIGDRFTLVENRENGWSKIQFEGKDAFIKTEFLEVVDEQAAETGAENTGAADTEAASGTVKAKTTVNIRASANENGERLGTIYQGEELEVIMKQADGWTKVKYQGQTAYVKSEFVE